MGVGFGTSRTRSVASPDTCTVTHTIATYLCRAVVGFIVGSVGGRKLRIIGTTHPCGAVFSAHLRFNCTAPLWFTIVPFHLDITGATDFCRAAVGSVVGSVLGAHLRIIRATRLWGTIDPSHIDTTSTTELSRAVLGSPPPIDLVRGGRSRVASTAAGAFRRLEHPSHHMSR